MDAGFASTMKTAVEDLNSAYSTFTGGTITEAVWNGDTATAAGNYVTEKIETKITEVETKLDNLITAIDYATSAEEKQAEIDEIASKKYTGNDLKEANAEIKKLEAERDELIDKITSLCK